MLFLRVSQMPLAAGKEHGRELFLITVAVFELPAFSSQISLEIMLLMCEYSLL